MPCRPPGLTQGQSGDGTCKPIPLPALFVKAGARVSGGEGFPAARIGRDPDATRRKWRHAGSSAAPVQADLAAGRLGSRPSPADPRRTTAPSPGRAGSVPEGGFDMERPERQSPASQRAGSTLVLCRCCVAAECDQHMTMSPSPCSALSVARRANVPRLRRPLPPRQRSPTKRYERLATRPDRRLREVLGQCPGVPILRV